MLPSRHGLSESQLRVFFIHLACYYFPSVIYLQLLNEAEYDLKNYAGRGRRLPGIIVLLKQGDLTPP